jgi:purine-binding chemotaxis protein CheW
MAQAAQAQRASSSALISTFYLGDALLGIDTLKVQEIIRVIDITRVHQAPDHVLGIINLRGKIVTIIDLGLKLGLGVTRLADESRIIIVSWRSEYIGLAIDRVADVISADTDKVMPSPANVKGVQGRFFQGVYNSDHHLISILDVEEVLGDDER